MSELERRLRDALHEAAEQPPPGLIGAVRKRHRRHQIRTGAGMAAVVAAAAIAAPSVAGALRAGGGGHGQGPVAGRSAHAAARASHLRPHAAPGTVLIGCGDGPNSGQLAPLSQYHARGRDLPLSFLPGGHSSGPIRLYVAIAVLQGMRPGSTVVVRVPGAYRGDLRFLYADSLAPGTRYTMRSGETGVTFAACSQSKETYHAAYTDYYGGYLVLGSRCVPVDVWSSGRQLGEIRLGACQGR